MTAPLNGTNPFSNMMCIVKTHPYNIFNSFKSLHVDIFIYASYMYLYTYIFMSYTYLYMNALHLICSSKPTKLGQFPLIVAHTCVNFCIAFYIPITVLKFMFINKAHVAWYFVYLSGHVLCIICYIINL